MKITTYETREEWLAAREGKITGSSLKDITAKERGSGKKKGFYQLIADRIGVATSEDPMARGTRLEADAVARFVAETGKKVDTSLVIWTREDHPDIAISPDGFIKKGKKIREAVEAKCFDGANHIEVLLTGEIPSEIKHQTRQYFIVNDDLETLYIVFYNPDLSVKDYFVIEIHRDDIQEEIDALLEHEIAVLREVDEIVKSFTF